MQVMEADLDGGTLQLANREVLSGKHSQVIRRFMPALYLVVRKLSSILM